ncbi:hypothetical protein [Lignipirellula cremea]|uniref:Uncharacterized protein n=1 Tax=Lignipirellula cremea TaxID=2528010 RepID=A0A518DWI8_9BACT|nr:hypothetical protein [Lignipirellula cremea]QDU96205.1 hypothetical protein Pla8534_40240 [Lignipirellula cremea]
MDCKQVLRQLRFRSSVSFLAVLLALAALGCDKGGDSTKTPAAKPQPSTQDTAADDKASDAYMGSGTRDTPSSVDSASPAADQKWVIVQEEATEEYTVNVEVKETVEENGEEKVVTKQVPETRTRTLIVAKLVPSEDGAALEQLEVPAGWTLIQKEGQAPRLESTSETLPDGEGDVALPPLTPPDPFGDKPAGSDGKEPKAEIDALFDK